MWVIVHVWVDLVKISGGPIFCKMG
jgi:hypothetical protein